MVLVLVPGVLLGLGSVAAVVADALAPVPAADLEPLEHLGDAVVDDACPLVQGCLFPILWIEPYPEEFTF